MNQHLLKIMNVSKSFNEWRTEGHRFLSWFWIPFKPINKKWVLTSIDLDIKQGEAIGIIGKNGSGKSTLLKIISGTIEPTKGKISVKNTKVGKGTLFQILLNK